MHKVYEVFGLFEDPEEVASTVEELHLHGVRGEEIEVIVPEAGRYRLADESLHQDVVGLQHGAATGAVAGLAVGLVAAAASSLGIPGMVLAVLFFTGMGALVGGMAGMQRREHQDDDELHTRDVLAPEAARLVAVRSDHRARAARRVLERHGALFVDELAPHG